MKVLHVTPFYEPAWAYGGMARAAGGLCRALALLGHEVTVVTALLDASHPRDERLGGVHVLRFEVPVALSRRLFPWAPRLGGVLDAALRGCDVVHLHGHRSGLAWTARRGLRRTRVPAVLQPHGTFPHHGQQRLAKLVFDACVGDRVVSEAAALVAVSEAEARDLPRPARVVPNGVEAPGEPRSDRASGAPQLLFVGSDAPQKRAQVLPHLLAALPEARLDVVGRFGERGRESLQPLGDRVRIRGVLEGDALAGAYASADLLVHPAVREAFGLVPFEAALCGTPAVVAGGHGCGEWFGRAGGCVVPPDDFGALAAAVRARLENRARGAAEAGAVADFARRELTWDRAAAAVERIYAEVAGRAP